MPTTIIIDTDIGNDVDDTVPPPPPLSAQVPRCLSSCHASTVRHAPWLTLFEMQWAIAMALNCPELDLRFVLTAGPGLHDDRAKMVAKLLEVAGRGDIPIGQGCDQVAPAETAHATGTGTGQRQEDANTGSSSPDLPQSPWVMDYDLSAYAGGVATDGVEKLIEIVMASPEPLTLIAIGPLGNVGEVILRRLQSFRLKTWRNCAIYPTFLA